MNPVKTWFMSRLFREKVLVFAFLLLGALIWLSSASDRLKGSLRDFRAAESALATQQLWLNNRPAIEEAAAAAVRNLDPAKTYDATFLVAEIMGIAGRAGLAVNTEPPRTQRSPQFSVHTVQVTTRRAELSALLKFYQELASKAPYLGLEQVSLQGDRSSPGAINATLQVASVELVREGGSAAK
jgi:DNA-binding cell septation regulator SpoVG